MQTPNPLDTCVAIVSSMEAPPPENITSDQLPTPWLADSDWLLEELAKTREQALRIPVSLNSASDIKSVIDRIWRLEDQLRWLLRLHRQGQEAFAQKHARSVNTTTERGLSKQKRQVRRGSR